MGALKNIIYRMKARKGMLAEATVQDRVSSIVTERKKSSNERELEKRLEEKRQEDIKRTLERMRAQERRETFTSNNLLKGKAIFKGKTTVLNNNPKLNSAKHNNFILNNKHKGGMLR